MVTTDKCVWGGIVGWLAEGEYRLMSVIELETKSHALAVDTESCPCRENFVKRQRGSFEQACNGSTDKNARTLSAFFFPFECLCFSLEFLIVATNAM